ncbi:hypothetical protein Ancab_004588 [Ancistrocladus abbreviatus]
MFLPYSNHVSQEQRPVIMSRPSLSMMFNGVHHHQSQPSINSILPQSYQFPCNLTLNAGLEIMGTLNFGAGSAAEGMHGRNKSYQEEAYYGEGSNGVENGIGICSYNHKLMKKNRRRSGAELPEKVQQRMIKNRESAARSRARRMAYNAQQKIEITQLKQENEILRKTIGFVVSAMPKIGSKETKASLKRTFSGPL